MSKVGIERITSRLLLCASLLVLAPRVGICQGTAPTGLGPGGAFSLPPFNTLISTGVLEFGSFDLGANVVISMGQPGDFRFGFQQGSLGEILSISCTVQSGDVPPGLKFTSFSAGRFDCVLSGIPSSVGSYNFTYTVTAAVLIQSGGTVTQVQVPLGTFTVHLSIVPAYAQGLIKGKMMPWGDEIYDDYTAANCPTLATPGCHMSQVGCLLTALAMASAAAGLTNQQIINPSGEITPSDINSIAKDVNVQIPFAPVFNKKHNPSLLTIVARLRNSLKYNPAFKPVQWRDVKTSTHPGLRLETALADGFPVIVSVPEILKCKIKTPLKFGGHFVLVTNEQSDGVGNKTFYIHDPGCSEFTTLDKYMATTVCPNCTFNLRGGITDPPDLSALSVSATDSVEITLVNSSAQRAGFDPASGQHVEEIENSFFNHDSIADPETGEEYPGSNFVDLYAQPPQTYTLVVTGVQAGTYEIIMTDISTDGSIQPAVILSGPSMLGGTTSFTVTHSPAPGAKLHEVPTKGADVNGDGVVNCADLEIVKSAFGKKAGDPGFDSRADINGDGIVNILDLSAVARALPAGTVCN